MDAGRRTDRDLLAGLLGLEGVAVNDLLDAGYERGERGLHGVGSVPT